MDEKKFTEEEEKLITDVSDKLMELIEEEDELTEIIYKFGDIIEINDETVSATLNMGHIVYNKMVQQNLTKSFVKVCSIINEKDSDAYNEATEQLKTDIELIKLFQILFKTVELATLMSN